MSWTCPHCGAVRGCFGNRSPILTPPIQPNEKDKEIIRLRAIEKAAQNFLDALDSESSGSMIIFEEQLREVMEDTHE